MTTFVLRSIFVILLSFTNIVAGNARIVGGNEAPPVFGRFHASLQNLMGYHVCGGAVISKRHVVTAAHCLHEALPKFIKVLVGTTNLNKGGIRYDVESFIIYDEFNFTERINDIGLIRVCKPFDMAYVSVIKLDDAPLYEGHVVFLSGFGAQQQNQDTVDQMQILTIPVFDQETCRFAMRYTREVYDHMFCTFSRIGEGTCSGDSGSPILRGDRLVGVVSWGIPCARGFPDVHTRIAPYKTWLKMQIRYDMCYIAFERNRQSK